MPQIIITAEPGEDRATVLHKERVTAADFESRHFAQQLLERIDWAVKDAADREREAAQELGADARRDRPAKDESAAPLEQVLVGLA
jgi:hypothetical protein